MRVEINTEFKPGDKVWRKDLVTNESYQVTIKRVHAISFIEDGKQEDLVMYFSDDEVPMCNIPGNVSAGNAFATKEDADACPAYVPQNNHA